MTAKVNPVWVQGHYRFRNDDGSLATATYIAAQDTSASIDVDTTFRLRVSWGESAGQNQATASGLITVQFDKNASGTWTTVGAATAVKTATSSQSISDGTADNNARLTLPTGVATFSAGEFDDNNSGTSRTPVDQGYEYEFCLQIDSAQVVNADSITFRLLYGGNVFGSVDAVPTATVVEAATEATGTLSSSVGNVTLSGTGVAPFGKLYYVIYPSAASAPSATQIKAGQQQSGSAATASGNEWANATSGEQIFASDATGLTAGTSYRIAFVWNYDTLDSNVVVSDAWSTTGSAGPVGTLSLSIGDITLTAAGSVAADGTLSLSVGDLVLAALGAVTVDGDLSSSIGDITLSAAGAVAVDGTLSSSVGDITLSAAGEVTDPSVIGTLEKAVGNVTLLARTIQHDRINFVGGRGGNREGSLSTTTQALTALFPGTPDAPSEGDLILVGVAVASQGRNPDCAISGWSTVGTQVNEATATYDTSMQVSYMFAGPTPPTEITIPATGHVDDAQAWIVYVLRNVHPNVAFDVSAEFATGTGTSRADPGAVTPVTEDSWVIPFGAGAANISAQLFSGLTRSFSTNRGLVNRVALSVGYSPWNGSGAYDPAQFTGGNDDAANSWAAITLALRPNIIAATLSSSVGDITLSATAQALVDGDLSSTVSNITLSAAGAIAVDGDLSSSVGDITLSAAAQALVDGTLSSSVGSLVITAEGEVLVTGTLSSDLGSLTLTANGAAAATSYGTLDSSVGDVTLSATAAAEIDGDLTQDTGELQLAASGLAVASGALTQDVGEITLSAAAQALVDGTLDQLVGSVVITAAGEVLVTGTLSSSIGSLSLTADGAAGIFSYGTLDSSVGDVTLSAAGTVVVTGTLDRSIGVLTVSGTGEVAVSGALSSSIGDVVLTGLAAVDIVGNLTRAIGDVALTGEADLASLGALDQAVGDITLSAAGTIAVAGTLDLSTGEVILTAAGGAQVTGTLTQSIGNLQLLATGVTPVVGSLSASIGTITLPAEGVVGSIPVVGSLNSSIGDILLTDAQGLVFSSEESSDWLVRHRREAIR